MVVYRGVGNSNKYAIQADIATDNEIINLKVEKVIFHSTKSGSIRGNLIQRKTQLIF